jgi:hypothetical protein
MPTTFCSKKLSKLAGIKTRLPSLSMDNWNGHLFALQGRKCVVFVHKETFYSFVVFDVLKKQLLDFKQTFIEGFINQLAHDELLSDGLKKLIQQRFENVEFSTTDGDKSTIGYLNDCIARLTWERNGRPPTIDETRIYVENYYNGNLLISKKFGTPKGLMKENLKSYLEQ